MKRITTLALALALSFSLAACSTGNTASGSESTPDSQVEVVEKDYAAIISDARTEEENEVMMIVYPDGIGGYLAIDGYSADYEPEFLTEDVNNFMAPMLGFDVALAEDFAFSVSMMNTQSYGYAVVMPTEGNTDAIVSGLEAFIDNQRNTFENYLVDQLEIANAATVTVAESGEVIMACGPDSETVRANIEAALKG